MRRHEIERRRDHPILETWLSLGFVFLLGVYGSLSDVRAEVATSPTEAETPSCSEDALGARYCAPEPTGTAVRDTLGRVLCAPGTCVLVDETWHCASVRGGAAFLERDGEPECDGGCAAPEHTYCVKP